VSHSEATLLAVSRGLLISLMMEAANTSETSVNFYQTTRRSIPEDSHLHVSLLIVFITLTVSLLLVKKSKAVPLHAMEAHGGRGGIAPTHS
jgi:hypothetical protein